VWLMIFPFEDRRRSPSPHHPAGRIPSGTRAEIPYSQPHPFSTYRSPRSLTSTTAEGNPLVTLSVRRSTFRRTTRIPVDVRNAAGVDRRRLQDHHQSISSLA